MGGLKLFSLSNVIMLWGMASMLGMNPSAQLGKFLNNSAPVQTTAANNAMITAAFGQNNMQGADVATMVGQLLHSLTTTGITANTGQKVSNAVPVKYAAVQVPL